MKYVLFSVVASTLVLVIFRLMERAGADTRHSITVSYLVAAATGLSLFSPRLFDFTLPWFWPAAVEGAFFYLVFRLMARTAQVNGIAVASIATKMSVVIPISIGIVVLNEDANILKLLGVAAGFCAVFLAAGSNLQVNNWKWPILVFISTGAIDASFKLFQVWGVSQQQFPQFITTIFAFAFLTGLLHHLLSADRRINAGSVLCGAALGVANFGSVFFVLKALAEPQWESSIIYPINNFGVVVLSTVAAVAIFGESLSKRGWVGLALAIAAIILLFMGSIDG